MVEIPERFRTPLVYTLPGMEQVPVAKDLVYRLMAWHSTWMCTGRSISVPANAGPARTRMAEACSDVLAPFTYPPQFPFPYAAQFPPQVAGGLV